VRSVIGGPPARSVERLHEIAAAGVTNLMLTQFVEDQFGFMRTFTDEIPPEFRCGSRGG
jgi:hypothetical protein